MICETSVASGTHSRTYLKNILADQRSQRSNFMNCKFTYFVCTRNLDKILAVRKYAQIGRRYGRACTPGYTLESRPARVYPSVHAAGMCMVCWLMSPHVAGAGRIVTRIGLCIRRAGEVQKRARAGVQKRAPRWRTPMACRSGQKRAHGRPGGRKHGALSDFVESCVCRIIDS